MNKRKRRKDLAAKLGEAVIEQAKLIKQLKEQNILCNKLAAKVEKLKK